jgi:hypothetical protein
MFEITEYLNSKNLNYKIINVVHPTIEEKYGTISFIKINLDNKKK